MTNSDTAPRLYQVYLTDLDGNGHLDLFVGGLGSYRLWQGLGNGRFASHLRGSYH